MSKAFRRSDFMMKVLFMTYSQAELIGAIVSRLSGNTHYPTFTLFMCVHADVRSSSYRIWTATYGNINRIQSLITC